jgi:putative peptide zinc metalloprotease protein
VTTIPGVVTGERSPGQASAGGPAGAREPAPTHAEGLQFLGEMSGSGYRRPPALVRRADGQTITLTPLLYAALSAMDGRRSLTDVARVLSSATGRQFHAQDVEYLAQEKLRPLGLLAGADGAQPVTTKMSPLLALRLKFVVTDRRLTRRLTAPFAGLFVPPLVAVVVAAFGALTWWLLVDKGLASAVHQAFYEPGMILLLWALIVLSAVFHEFGHAAACRYGGATPGAMGGGLYLVWPAFYTEVTDSYRLGKAGRLRVDLGGLYFNAIFAVVVLGTWAVTGWDALLLVAVAQHLQMVRQLAPFIRADGYHIVADLTGVPDLFAHIKPTLMSVLPRRLRPSATPALKTWARVVVVLWVATVVPVLVTLIGLATLVLPRLAATAGDSMRLQWEAAAHYWEQGDPIGVGVRLMAALIVCLPILGIVYLLVRIGRRTARWAWRSTDHSALGRAAVLMAGTAVLAGIAWAWWPDGQYRAVQADERGSLTDVVRVEDRRIFLPLLTREVGVLRLAPVSAPGPVTTYPSPEAEELPQSVPPQGLLSPGASPAAVLGTDPEQGSTPGTEPPATDPIEGTVATGDEEDAWTDAGDDDIPAQSGGEGSAVEEPPVAQWPFPFARPEAAGDGDNQALAVNTQDGSVVTDLAVSWAIVTANQVLERNEAWALASCQDCLTRAVAFQFLMLTADSGFIAPVNAAVAANYDCTRCTTEAIAVQLVVSLTAMPSDDAVDLIGDVMQRLDLLEADLDTLSAGQVYFVLQATQAEIIRILEDDGVVPDAWSSDTVVETAATGTVSASPSDTSAPDASVEPSPMTDPTADSTTSDDTPTDGASGSTSEPSATELAATSEPSPTPDATSEPSPTEDSSSESPSEPVSSTSGESTSP